MENKSIIQASELRIGNYVYDNLGGILQIKGISTDSDLSHIHPIPLTEQILLDCVFEQTLDGFVGIKITSGIYLEINLITERTILFSKKNLKYIDLRNIEHLHDLQNLYFALTKKELHIKNIQSANN